MPRLYRASTAAALAVLASTGCSGSNGDPTDGTTGPTCNGRADACDLPLDQAVFAIAHNAMNVEDEGWSYPNQHYGYERQVADGIRGFMLDVYDVDGVVTLCHADCSLGSEPFADALDRFAALLDANPGDVYVFVLQDEIAAEPVVAAIEASGLASTAIGDVPPWPTLGELIDAGTRLLVTHEQPRDGAPVWYHPAYALAWDNDYSATTVDDFDCAVLRGDPANDVFLMNHFLTAFVGSADLAAQANTEAALLDHVDRCEAETGDDVSWLAVDFYDVGDVMSVISTLGDRAAARR